MKDYEFVLTFPDGTEIYRGPIKSIDTLVAHIVSAIDCGNDVRVVRKIDLKHEN